MLKLPDKSINQRQLNEELAILKLPGFKGTARLSREIDKNGNVVLINGAVKKVAPYILVKCGSLTAAQKTAITQAVTNHVPVDDPPPSPRFEEQAKAIEAATNFEELKAANATLARKL